MASFSKFVKVGRRVVSYKFEGAAHHAVVLHLPGNIFSTESGSVDEACKKKRTCIVLYWVAY